MSRHARLKSKTGIYHIMVRGNNKDRIFFEESDYKKYLGILSDCKKISQFELFAYCLMPNHIHLLLKENKEDVGLIMKRIGCRFVYWYNAKYNRIGHLFQDRFKSEPIETDEYFLCALRYIHNNPIEAGIVKRMEDYSYSSYPWYFKNGNLVDKSYTFTLINESEFAKLHQQQNEKKDFIDIVDTAKAVTDEQAIDILSAILKIEPDKLSSISNIQTIKKHLFAIKKMGVSDRQIARITGFSRYMLNKE